MKMEKMRPEDISEIFGKLHLCHSIIYDLYLALKDNQPEMVVLNNISSCLFDSLRELDGYIDMLLNPSKYGE